MQRNHPDAWSNSNIKTGIFVPIQNADIGIRKVVYKDSSRREPYTSIKKPTKFRPENDAVYRTLVRTKTDATLMDRSKSRMKRTNKQADDEASDGARTNPELELRGVPAREKPVYTNKIRLDQAKGASLRRTPENDDSEGITEARLLKIEIGDLLAELELLRNENEGLARRLRERERKERLGDDEKNRLQDRIKELENWQTRLQLQLDSQGKDDETRNRVLQSEINKLLSDLDRKSKLVDQLVADNERQKALSIPVERERDLQRQLDEMMANSEMNHRKLQDAKYELDMAKRNRVPREREQDLMKQLEEVQITLKSKERLIDELTRDKREILLAKEDVEKRLEDLRALAKELERDNSGMTERKASLEDVIAAMKADMERLRMEKEEKENERLKVQLKFNALEERSKGVLDIIRPLQELVREQDSHITDLQREVDTMRKAINDYQREMEKLRVLVNDEESTRDKFQDIAVAHRRLLDENSRLINLLERRQVVDARSLTDQSQMKVRLEQARHKLKSSQNRIAQLEDWLDDIYNDKHFDVVLKNSTVTGAKAAVRRSLSPPTLTLPLVPTYRGGLGDTRRQMAKRKLASLDTKLGYLTDRI